MDTPHGPASAHLHRAERAARRAGPGSWRRRRGDRARPEGGHGGASREGVSVAWSSSPTAWRAGARPAPAHQLDAAWMAVTAHLMAGELAGLAHRRRRALGGRAGGVPHGGGDRRGRGAVPRVPAAAAARARARRRRRSRLAELDAVRVPMLVVQGVEATGSASARGRAPDGGGGPGRPQPQDRCRCGGGRGERVAPRSRRLRRAQASPVGGRSRSSPRWSCSPGSGR